MASLRKTSVLQNNAPPGDRIDQLLDTVGDGTGTTEQAADFSAAPAEFMYKPKPGTAAVLARMLISIEDGAVFAANQYAGIAALTNGITIKVKDSSGGVIHNFTPNPITKTYHWGLLAGSDVSPIAFAAGADRCLVRWTFDKAGAPLLLDGDKGEYLSVVVFDDLSGLVSQLMQVQGFTAYA